jgi:hypothetical protein
MKKDLFYLLLAAMPMVVVSCEDPTVLPDNLNPDTREVLLSTPETFAVEAGAASRDILVTTTLSVWTVTVEQNSWCQVARSNTSVKASILANRSADTSRSVKITVASGDAQHKSETMLTQAAATVSLSLSANVRTPSKDGAEVFFAVNSNTTRWEMRTTTNNGDWLSNSRVNATRDSVWIQVAANSTGATRVDTVIVTVPQDIALRRIVTVTQATQ